MQTITANASEPIRFARTGEHGAVEVKFDVTGFLDSYGEGDFAIFHKRRGDATAYPVTMRREGNDLIWMVSLADTAREGSGEAEISFYRNGELLAKSEIYQTYCEGSLGGTEAIPHDTALLIDALSGRVAQAEASLRQTQTEMQAAIETAAQNEAQTVEALREQTENALGGVVRSNVRQTLSMADEMRARGNLDAAQAVCAEERGVAPTLPDAEDGEVKSFTVYGRSIVWNQLVPETVNPAFSDYYSRSNGLFRVNCTVASPVKVELFNGGAVSGHKYYFFYRPTARSCGNAAPFFYLQGYSDRLRLVMGDRPDSVVWDYPGTTRSDLRGIVLYLPAGTYNCSFYLALCDLTRMFGAGNEPTAQEMRQWLSKFHYPYEAGRLQNRCGTYEIFHYDPTGEMDNVIWQSDLGGAELRGIGAYCDSYDAAKGTLSRSVFEEDLGSLEWHAEEAQSAAGGRIRIWCAPFSQLQSGYRSSPLLCRRFQYAADTGAWEKGTVTFRASDGTLCVYDDALAALNDPQAVKSALAGEILLYPGPQQTESVPAFAPFTEYGTCQARQTDGAGEHMNAEIAVTYRRSLSLVLKAIEEALAARSDP